MADLTVFTTVLSGTLVYVIGQIILKFFIEPVQELKKTIGVISHSLIERANVIYNPGISVKEVEHETSRELRNLASHLRSHLCLIPWYPWTARMFGLPTSAEIQKASKALMGLSNGVFEDKQRHNHKLVKWVCDSLGVPEPD
jgi:hypothetical protein